MMYEGFTQDEVSDFLRAVTTAREPEPVPPTVIELDSDDVREMAAEFAAAAGAGMKVRVMVDPVDGFKVSAGHHRWSPGFGTVWS